MTKVLVVFMDWLLCVKLNIAMICKKTCRKINWFKWYIICKSNREEICLILPGLFFETVRDIRMKCLMKYQWVKLPRNLMPEGIPCGGYYWICKGKGNRNMISWVAILSDEQSNLYCSSINSGTNVGISRSIWGEINGW